MEKHDNTIHNDVKKPDASARIDNEKKALASITQSIGPSNARCVEDQVTPGSRSSGSPEPIRTPKKPLAFYMSVFAICLMALITSWDATSLAIALPTITDDLHGTTLQSFWASTSFILGVTITQPIYVSVSDVFGRKHPLYACMILFAVGSLIFATAKDMIVLIIGRLIQGTGAGGLDVLEEIILTDITTLKERPAYLALVALAVTTGSIAGPILGAVFSEFDWRWIGYINLPIVGVSFVLCFFFLRLRPIDIPLREKVRQLDWTGIVLFTFGATATAVPVSYGNALYPWASWRTLVPLIIGLILLGIFAVYEKKPANPILPYRLFSNATSVASLITSLLHGLVLYTGLLYIPLFFQATLLEDALGAAKSMLPLSALVVASSFLVLIGIEVTRQYRLFIWLGWVLMAVFSGLWSLVGRSTSRAETYVFEALLGAGNGIVFTGTQVPMQASVQHVDDTGLAVGMLVVFRLFGALIGLAVSSTAFSSVFQANLAMLGPLPDELSALQDSSQAIAFLPILRTLDLPPNMLEAVIGTYLHSFRAVWYILAAVSGVGFLVSLFIKELSLEKDDVGRQGFGAPS
ncbi:MFS general substrate transporter [Hypoxylon argillaceum]|nr:MFS general substrate transporter [Hypoxylon argillaceum]KAI1148832.1 MFS general substrate transporter [Nemania diffusa]